MTINCGLPENDEWRACAAIHSACFPSGWSEAELKAMCGVARTGLLVGRKDGQVAGFIMVRQIVDEAEILTLAVAPASRRQGVGRALMAAAFGWARAGEAQTLFLDVRQGNDAAEILYGHTGFKVIARRGGYYPNGRGVAADALIMQAKL